MPSSPRTKRPTGTLSEARPARGDYLAGKTENHRRRKCAEQRTARGSGMRAAQRPDNLMIDAACDAVTGGSFMTLLRPGWRRQ